MTLPIFHDRSTKYEFSITKKETFPCGTLVAKYLFYLNTFSTQVQRWCTLYVLDVNDNHPRFLDAPYFTSIPEVRIDWSLSRIMSLNSLSGVNGLFQDGWFLLRSKDQDVYETEPILDITKSIMKLLVKYLYHHTYTFIAL